MALQEVTGFDEATVHGALRMGARSGGGKFADQALVPKIFRFLLWNAAFLGAFSVFASTVVVLFLVGTGFALF